MAIVNEHLSVEELEERYVACSDADTCDTVWPRAKSQITWKCRDAVATTAFGERWIEQLLTRYNADGPDALGDLRRRNGATATILKSELLAKLRDRLGEPPQDGGLWSSRKVANWMAAELGLASVAPQRGWEALKAIGWSIQAPRPKNPKSATPEEAAAFKKSLPTPLPGRLRSIPAKRSRSSPRTSTALA
jgi:transposase